MKKQKDNSLQWRKEKNINYTLTFKTNKKSYYYNLTIKKTNDKANITDNPKRTTTTQFTKRNQKESLTHTQTVTHSLTNTYLHLHSKKK